LQKVELNEIKILYETNNPITDIKIDGMDTDDIDEDSAT